MYCFYNDLQNVTNGIEGRQFETKDKPIYSHVNPPSGVAFLEIVMLHIKLKGILSK